MASLSIEETHDNRKYCLAKPGELYLVYLPYGGSIQLDLTGAAGKFVTRRFSPRTGELSDSDQAAALQGDNQVTISAPRENNEDWLIVIRKQ